MHTDNTDSTTYERNIIGTWHRNKQVLTTRRYVRLDTAIRRLSQLAVLEGEPKDVIELSHAITGMQLGTMRVGVGQLTTNWIWDKS